MSRNQLYFKNVQISTDYQWNLKRTPNDKFDGVLSRAFASMTGMVEWCQHLPKDGCGRFMALKGQRPDDEVEQLPSWCSVTSIKSLHVPELEGERHLVVLSRRG